jgi:hypothetical protein
MNTPENRDETGRFRPGASGNPGGRPKDEHGIAELARGYGPEAIERLAKLMRDEDARVSQAACVALLDRGYGRPKQAIDHGIDATDDGVRQLVATAEQLRARIRGDK